MESWIHTAISVLEGYVVLGAVFAVLFSWRGVGRIAPSGSHFTWGFRLMILPAAAALWPLLAGRWIRRRPPSDEPSAHRRDRR